MSTYFLSKVLADWFARKNVDDTVIIHAVAGKVLRQQKGLCHSTARHLPFEQAWGG